MTDRFMDGYDDPWGPAGRYGGKLVNWMVQSRAGVSVDDLGEAVPEEKFNNEGEKQMEKIDWHKPLRVLDSLGEPQDGEARTYKSGKQRVVWVDERVYPVDDQGRATAEVWYSGDRNSRPRVGALKGSKLVENAPEEKFFVGLARNPDGTYWLTDGGMVSDTGTMNYWKRLMTDQPHWIVDTRSLAEPPKAIEHDPEDWVALYYDERDESAAVSDHFETESAAREKGDMAVRIRTTPAPVDTSRYIQLYRLRGCSPNTPWYINDFGAGRQEMTAAEVRAQTYGNQYCVIKVRD